MSCIRTKTSYSERISKRATPLVVWATAMASYRKREDIDDPHPFQRFWTKLISLRERSSWVRRTLVEFLKSHISKYNVIGFSMEIQKRHCHRNPAAPEFLLKVLCILKYVILEIPTKFSALNLIVLEGKLNFLQTVKNKISPMTLSRLCYDFEQQLRIQISK